MKRYLITSLGLLATIGVACGSAVTHTASPTSTAVPTPTLRAVPTATIVPTATPTATPTASHGASIGLQLRIAETALAGPAGLAITLVEVSEDSRCPSGLTCFWPGQTTVVVDLVEGDRVLGRFSLTLNPVRKDLAAAIAEGHVIKLVSLDPYPVSTRRTRLEEYIASLVLYER